MINTMSKIRGQEKGPGYPQAEALLAEAMLKFGRELGDDCNFGKQPLWLEITVLRRSDSRDHYSTILYFNSHFQILHMRAKCDFRIANI